MGKRLDEIAARHRPDPRLFWFTREDGTRDYVNCCVACSGRRWPCDAALLLMHIARREAAQEPGTEG